MNMMLTILFALLSLPAAHAEEANPLSGARFQTSPFTGVCQGVALLPNQDYLANKSFWDEAIPKCGVDVQVLPDTGFFATMTSRLGQATDQDEAVSFLKRVAQRTIEDIDFNNKVTELWIHCAKGDSAWLEAKRASAKAAAGNNAQLAAFEEDFYDPAKCSDRLAQLKDVVKKDGREFRINREMMRYTASAEKMVLNAMRSGMDKASLGALELVLPGEKVPLTDDEKAEVARLQKEVDAKAHASLERDKRDNLERVAKLREDKSRPMVGPGSALDDPSVPGWFKQWYIETDGGKRPNAVTARPYDDQQFLNRRGAEFSTFFKGYSQSLGEARILAFLDTREPDDASLAAAASRLLENGKSSKEEALKLLAIADGAKTDKKKINQLTGLMQNGPVLRELLKEDPTACHTAVGIANFISNKSSRNGALLTVGLGVGGIAITVAGPAVLTTAGLSAGGAALTTTVLSTSYGLASAGRLLATDAARYSAAKKRTLNVAHTDQSAFGAGRAIAELDEIFDARDTFVIDVAVTLAAEAAPVIYQKFFAEDAAQLGSDAVMKRLTADTKQGGLGLSDADARKLLSDAFSRDTSVSKPAVSRLAKALGIEEGKITAMQDIVMKELASPDVQAGNVPPKSFLERITSRLHASAKVKPDPEAYQRLRAGTIAQYFPDTKEVQVQPMFKATGASLTDAAVKRFQTDFDALLDQRSALFDIKAGDFRQWMTKKYGTPYPKLDAVTLETVFKKQGATLEDYQSAVYLTYAMEMKSQGVDVLSHLHISEIGRLGLTLGKKTAAFVGGMLVTAVSVGPATNLVNSLLSAPMQPVMESAAQLSNVMFSNMTSAISKSLSKHMKKITTSMAQVSSTTSALDETSFDGLSREDARKLMDGFDARYTEIFMRMAAYMPPYKRGGRDVMRDWWIMQPMQLANNASTFNMEFTLNQALLVAVQDKVKGREPTDQEKQLMQQYKENMETAENRLAVALATWKIYTFTYAEASRDPMMKDTNAKMMNALQHYEKFMNMDKYRSELSSKVKEAFLQFDPTFKELPKLEHRRTE